METANAEQDIVLSQLEQELERVKGHEAEADELRELVTDLEEQLAKLNTEVNTSKILNMEHKQHSLLYI